MQQQRSNTCFESHWTKLVPHELMVPKSSAFFSLTHSYSLAEDIEHFSIFQLSLVKRASFSELVPGHVTTVRLLLEKMADANSRHGSPGMGVRM